jgi:hypothetical protein
MVEMQLTLQVARTARLAGRYSSVEEFTIPSSVEAGADCPFKITGHLHTSPPEWPNFAVGFAYIEGPMDEVTVVVDTQEFRIRPGQAVAVYTSPVPPTCTRITLSGKARKLEAGRYKFVALTGYVKEGAIYVDDRVEKTVEAVAPAWPWWLIPLAAGVGVVAVVGAVIAYEERRREELLLLLRK